LDILVDVPSIVSFIFTLGIGYLLLLSAYWGADRLSDWYSLDAFDKSLQTLVTGGTVTFVSLVILQAPLSYLVSETPSSDTFWWNWFSTNLAGIVFIETVVFSVVWSLLYELLSREAEIEYAT
jgi:hypothetical protein